MERSRPGRARDDDLKVELSWGDANASPALPAVTAVPEDPDIKEEPVPVTTPSDDEAARFLGIQHSIDALRDEVAGLRAGLADQRPRRNGAASPPQDLVLEELASLRAEIVALKRRVALRLDTPADRSWPDADLVARLVAERLAGVSDAPPDL